jgi:spermidine synthase
MDRPALEHGRKRLLFELFLLSGFCGLLYQVVWVRLAFASFGIIAPVISVVISVFMLGLAVGSWLGGRMIERLARTTGLSAIFFYAATELLIGTGAFVVPALFEAGRGLLGSMGEANSVAYLSLSAIAIGLAIFPWCVGMGATFPLVMAYVREHRDVDRRSFSHLYLANVVGASLGALLTALVLVEVAGFRHTLWIAGLSNGVIAAAACLLGLQSRRRGAAVALHDPGAPAIASGKSIPWVRSILFATGLASLGMEVVWTRNFSPVLGTQVYAFAALLVAYLVATWAGSWKYRSDLARGRGRTTGGLLALVALASLLPIVLNDPRILDGDAARAVMALASIFPFCAALGYLTPRLIDEGSGGDPLIAGRAYAINVLGCILGPVVASYAMLPLLGASFSLLLLSSPLFAFAVLARADLAPRVRRGLAAAGAALLGCAALVNVSYENPCPWTDSRCEVRRDYAATVVSQGEGMQKRLLVNGVGITLLTPITKYMAHLPLAFQGEAPRSALVICFGMGTTYRSLLSWNVQTTAVELVPSVRDAFPYYHADAAAALANPRGRVVIDDGRRFLDRTRETYDAIVVDPPPPVEAAGSSLLYSREFHEAVKRHLKPGGIFQTWFPFGEEGILRAIAGSLRDVFPHVRVYRSVEGWGFHFLASMQPIPQVAPAALLGRLPAAARRDLEEWSRDGVEADVSRTLGSELPIENLLPPSPRLRITDDGPYNEYYLLRRSLARR